MNGKDGQLIMFFAIAYCELIWWNCWCWCKKKIITQMWKLLYDEWFLINNHKIAIHQRMNVWTIMIYHVVPGAGCSLVDWTDWVCPTNGARNRKFIFFICHNFNVAIEYFFLRWTYRHEQLLYLLLRIFCRKEIHKSY